MGIKKKIKKTGTAVSLKTRAERYAEVIKTYYNIPKVVNKAELNVKSVVPIWTDREAKKYGGKLTDFAMGFVITIDMKVGEDLVVILPISKRVLPDIAGSDILRLAGMAITGKIREEMRIIERSNLTQ